MSLWRGDAMALPLRDESVHAVVCDPPYELGFMGKGWDASGVSYQVETWAEALRVLKPGGHLLAFGGTRTFHRLMCGIEDAGFEVRDTLCWLYGSGFPKSLDVSRAIDKEAGAEREVVGTSPNWRESKRDREQFGSIEVRGDNAGQITKPATDAAREWEGWGTALKPAWEPIVMARKPLAGTVAANVLAYGTGALNIDATRIDYQGDDDRESATPQGRATSTRHAEAEPDAGRSLDRDEFTRGEQDGRWPANVVLDEEAAALLDAQAGESASRIGKPRSGQSGEGWGLMSTGAKYDDSGGPSRFFYCAKASRAEREAGLDGLPPRRRIDSEARDDDAPGSNNPRLRTSTRRNDHPTVKPLALMTWLLRLVTPPGGIVLDQFAGSGTTGVAAKVEGIRFVGADMDAHYLGIARRRIARAATARQEVMSLGTFGCLTCGGTMEDHPPEGVVRFEWAETARPDGWWYYRTPDLEEPSLLRRNHPYAEHGRTPEERRAEFIDGGNSGANPHRETRQGSLL